MSKNKILFINFLLVVGSIILCCIFCESFIYFTDLDIKSLKATLFFDCADRENQKTSSNPNRLYELNPKSNFIYTQIHSKEIKYETEKRDVKVNSLGFRDRERDVSKPDGVSRIIVLGGSNTYGALVNNEDTFPAVMEKKLNIEYPGEYEVWNAGIHGYVTSQKVAYAKEIIKKYNPDLLIFQLSNWGRRGFVCTEDYEELFKENKELFKENIPFVFSNNKKITSIHYFLIEKSRFYRFIMANVNNIFVKFVVSDEQKGNYQQDKRLLIFHDYGESVNYRDFYNFVKENKNLKIILFDPVFSRMSEEYQSFTKFNNVEKFYLDNASMSEEYCDIHPPTYVYNYYADELINFLHNNDYLFNN